jgi:RNA polymerase sigma-70 factor (ECF subfamily)
MITVSYKIFANLSGPPARGSRQKFMSINVEEYYTKYGPMVLRRCRSILRDEDRALDAMQYVFIKVLSRREDLTGDYPSSLLYRIATNICLNMLRDEKTRAESANDELLYYIADSHDEYDRLFAENMLDSIFMNEKESTREIAVMLYLDRMTLEQVADATGLSVSGVRKRMRTLKEKAGALREGLL